MRLTSAFNHVLFEKHASNGNTSGVLWQKQQKPKKKGEICEGRQEKNLGGLISTLSTEVVFLLHVKKRKKKHFLVYNFLQSNYRVMTTNQIKKKKKKNIRSNI